MQNSKKFKTGVIKKQIRFPVQQQAEKSLHNVKYNTGNSYEHTKCEIFSLVHDDASRCAKTNSNALDLRCV